MCINLQVNVLFQLALKKSNSLESLNTICIKFAILILHYTGNLKILYRFFIKYRISKNLTKGIINLWLSSKSTILSKFGVSGNMYLYYIRDNFREIIYMFLLIYFITCGLKLTNKNI